MSNVSIQELGRDPLGYLRRVEEGESFVVLRGQQPVAEITPVAPETNEPRPFGLCDGQFKVPDDFDQPLPEEILKDFEGR